jgi:hypothetical protein
MPKEIEVSYNNHEVTLPYHVSNGEEVLRFRMGPIRFQEVIKGREEAIQKMVDALKQIAVNYNSISPMQMEALTEGVLKEWAKVNG